MRPIIVEVESSPVADWMSWMANDWKIFPINTNPIGRITPLNKVIMLPQSVRQIS